MSIKLDMDSMRREHLQVYKLKVRKGGQTTIPKPLREQLEIEDGDTLIAFAEEEYIVLKKMKLPEDVEPIGEQEYKRIIKELEELRKKWEEYL